MGAEFTLYDYMDENGVNLIDQWLKGREVPKQIRVKMTKWLLHLEATPPGQWRRPQVDTLTDHCDGLFEVRAPHAGTHYRILGSHTHDREPTLLHAFVKRTPRVPDSDCDVALDRAVLVIANPANRRMEHNYG